MKKALLLILTITIFSCTNNQRARTFGGTIIENLPADTKLINITWKQDNMWILTKKMQSNDIAERYNFVEKSSFGLVEGDVIIIETKSK